MAAEICQAYAEAGQEVIPARWLDTSVKGVEVVTLATQLVALIEDTEAAPGRARL